MGRNAQRAGLVMKGLQNFSENDSHEI